MIENDNIVVSQFPAMKHPSIMSREEIAQALEDIIDRCDAINEPMLAFLMTLAREEAYEAIKNPNFQNN